MPEPSEVFGEFQYPTAPLEGAARGAPLAVQVADRWHLLHNLASAVERMVGRHRCCLREPGQAQAPSLIENQEPHQDGPLEVRTRVRHADVHTALGKGLTVTEVSRTLGLDRKTVRRYAAVTTADELIEVPARGYSTVLDPHMSYLHQRWEEGCRSTNQLHAEIQVRGYRGSLRTLRRHTAALRTASATPAAPKPPCSAPKLVVVG